jgi:Domain of unknown function (DUF4105)
MTTPVHSGERHSPWLRYAGRFLLGIAWFAASLFALWALAALWFDVRIAWLRIPAIILFALSLPAIIVLVRGRWRRLGAWVVCTALVLFWWLSLKPSDTGNWQENVSRVAWAEIHGDQVILHNVRNCDYRSETEYSNCWSDRTLDLSKLYALDFFLTNWGITWASHPILSFQFSDGQRIAFSIEARYKVGQDYSVLRGFFRQYSLIVIPADERDVIRLRTNFRTDHEEVYLYRLQVGPNDARKMFLSYLNYLNKIKNDPIWYNTVTRNCTSTMDRQLASDVGRFQWSYQFLLNGKMDHLMYDRNRLVTDGLPFEELKEREHINTVAHAVGNLPDFSDRIRQGRVGF